MNNTLRFGTATKMMLLCVLCLVFSHVVLSSGQLSSGTEPDCREPTNVTEMYRTLRQNVIDTVGIVQDESTVDIVQHEATITTLNDTCHIDPHIRICNCSSRQELNFDPNRIPKVLVQTSCCSENEKDFSNWTIRCKEVHHLVRVFRRVGCTEGTFRYSTKWERVPIGCTCHVTPNVF